MTEWTEERRARAALTWLAEGGNLRLAAAVAAMGAVETFEELSSVGPPSWNRRAKTFDLDGLLDESGQSGVRFIIPGDEEWPARLDDLDRVQLGATPGSSMGGAPLGLWVRGPARLDEWCERSVAMVGARSSTPYGERVATDLSIDLAGQGDKAGWTIVSGGAYGIDGWSHRGALACGGRTVAVLASGLDRPYPAGNSRLFDQLVREHVLVSEMPVGLHPTRAAFLARNRIIAALSVGTVVVEAGARSGARNTANWANALDRVVMAVPGSVHSGQSVTPHRLIRDQEATLVASAADVLALICSADQAPQLPLGGECRPWDDLDPTLAEVREALPARNPISVGEVAQMTGLSIRATMASLSQLESKGLARCNALGEWVVARPR